MRLKSSSDLVIAVEIQNSQTSAVQEPVSKLVPVLRKLSTSRISLILGRHDVVPILTFRVLGNYLRWRAAILTIYCQVCVPASTNGILTFALPSKAWPLEIGQLGSHHITGSSCRCHEPLHPLIARILSATGSFLEYLLSVHLLIIAISLSNSVCVSNENVPRFQMLLTWLLLVQVLAVSVSSSGPGKKKNKGGRVSTITDDKYSNPGFDKHPREEPKAVAKKVNMVNARNGRRVVPGPPEDDVKKVRSDDGSIGNLEFDGKAESEPSWWDRGLNYVKDLFSWGKSDTTGRKSKKYLAEPGKESDVETVGSDGYSETSDNSLSNAEPETNCKSRMLGDITVTVCDNKVSIQKGSECRLKIKSNWLLFDQAKMKFLSWVSKKIKKSPNFNCVELVVNVKDGRRLDPMMEVKGDTTSIFFSEYNDEPSIVYSAQTDSALIQGMLSKSEKRGTRQTYDKEWYFREDSAKKLGAILDQMALSFSTN